MVKLQGKPIVITGASSGIGAATALACARAGMPVVVGARRKERLEDLCRTIERAGGSARAMELDVRDAAACRAMVDLCVREFGSIYGVYANAGYGEEVGAIEMTDAAVRDMFEVNFFGSLNIIRPAVEAMGPVAGEGGRGWRGHVLICSSCLAQLPIPYYSVYSATKAAQHHLGRAMKLELEGARIAVTTIHPVGTKTEFFTTVERRSVANGKQSKLLSHSPELFMQTPEFVARKTVRALRRPHSELWPGLMGNFTRFGMSVLTMWPGLGDMVLRGMVKRRVNHWNNGGSGGNGGRGVGGSGKA